MTAMTSGELREAIIRVMDAGITFDGLEPAGDLLGEGKPVVIAIGGKLLELGRVTVTAAEGQFLLMLHAGARWGQPRELAVTAANLGDALEAVGAGGLLPAAWEALRDSCQSDQAAALTARDQPILALAALHEQLAAAAARADDDGAAADALQDHVTAAAQSAAADAYASAARQVRDLIERTRP